MQVFVLHISRFLTIFLFFFFFLLISDLFFGFDKRIILTCPAVKQKFQSIFSLHILVIFQNPNLAIQMV